MNTKRILISGIVIWIVGTVFIRAYCMAARSFVGNSINAFLFDNSNNSCVLDITSFGT